MRSVVFSSGEGGLSQCDPPATLGRRSLHIFVVVARLTLWTPCFQCVILSCLGRRTPHTTNCIASSAQEVRALPQNILYNALSVLIFLLHFIVAFSHLRTYPHAEQAISQESFPSSVPNRLTSLHCELGASATHPKRRSVLCRRSWTSSLCSVWCCFLPSVPDCLTFAASAKTDLARAFFF